LTFCIKIRKSGKNNGTTDATAIDLLPRSRTQQRNFRRAWWDN